MPEKTKMRIGTFNVENLFARFEFKALNRSLHIGRFNTKFLGLLALAWIMPSFASESEVDICWLRLKFDKEHSASNSISYLWERRILSGDLCWAQESTATNGWKDISNCQRKVKVGVALGGGIIRGMAHIGVLRVMEENNIPIYGIAGTSMGAIIGGLYACGYSLDTIEEIVKNEIDWKTIFSDRPPRKDFPLWKRLREEPKDPGIKLNLPGSDHDRLLDLSGFIVAQKLTDELAKWSIEADYLAGFDFNSLPIPFGALLTDINIRKLKLMRKGTISTALRASSSFPGVFAPMKIGDISYVDGGVLDNLPVDAFIRFDTTKAPDDSMNIIGKDTINYVIAVYPSNVGKPKVKKQEPRGPSGIELMWVMDRISSIARDYYVKDNWENAHAKIDVDVEGGFDFSPEKIDEMIQAGYDAASKKIFQIKGEIALKEDSVRCLSQHIHYLSSVEIDTAEVKESVEREKILKAIRLKEGSFVEKIDICDALKRIYNLGDFKEVTAKIKNTSVGWALTFVVEKKDILRNAEKIVVRTTSYYSVEKAIKDTIRKRKRALNFNEIKELVEKSLAKNGIVSSRVDSVDFRSSEEDDTLFIYVSRGTHLKGVAVCCSDAKTEKALKKEFNSLKPFSPENVLGKTKLACKEFSLKTIAIEGLKGDSLIISAEKNSDFTLQIPVLTLQVHEGITFFGEFRVRRFGNWSPYVNYTANYPLKRARELIRIDRWSIGYQSCHSFFPQMSVHYSGFSEIPELLSEEDFAEIGAQIALPWYFKHLFVTTIGLEEIARFEKRDTERQTNGVMGFQWDNLDRIVFPESGWKGDIDAKIGSIRTDSLWRRARARILGVPWRYKIQNTVMTTLTMRLFGSWYDGETTPEHERYSLGGLTPIGSHQLGLLDSEDLPGYKRDEIIEPLMWKAGGSARITFMEKALLGIRLNCHLESSLYFADAAPSWESLFSDDRKIKVCQAIGLYVDTSYLNIGLILQIGPKFSFSHIGDHIHFSVVYYSIGF